MQGFFGMNRAAMPTEPPCLLHSPALGKPVAHPVVCKV